MRNLVAELGLRAWGRRVIAGVASLVVLFTIRPIGSGPAASAEICLRGLPEEVSLARGHTFIGMVTAFPSRNKYDYVRFDVGNVYAGANEPPAGPLGGRIASQRAG
jgi:hypothetical protein